MRVHAGGVSRRGRRDHSHLFDLERGQAPDSLRRLVLPQCSFIVAQLGQAVIRSITLLFKTKLLPGPAHLDNGAARPGVP